MHGLRICTHAVEEELNVVRYFNFDPEGGGGMETVERNFSEDINQGIIS